MRRTGIILRKLNKIKSFHILMSAVVALVLYNEYLSYFIYSLRWPSLRNIGSARDNVRVLFVADPQLIGLQGEDETFGPITRWDSDRYLSRTYKHAYSSVQPDVVIFLGDLLDEGSIASDVEYQGYVDRFNVIFNSTGYAKHIYIAGDNDVGGEQFDRYEPWKVAKFEKKFNKESGMNSVNFVDFIHINYGYGVEIDRHLLSLGESFKAQSKGDLRILLNHIGVLERSYNQYEKVIKAIAPAFVFSAHHHKSYGIMGANTNNGPYHDDPRDRRKDITDWDVHHIPLTSKDAHSFQEIAVPTCSYRMGVKHMGYGAAVIKSDGMMEYSVLWIPSRYDQLYSYLYAPGYLMALLVLRCILTVCYTYRRQFCFGES